LKIKPLLVYHSENPRAFKKQHGDKSKLHVMGKSNSKALVTRDLFTEWINKDFDPYVQKHLFEMNLPMHQVYKTISLTSSNSSKTIFAS